MSDATWKKLVGRLLDIGKLVDSKIPIDKESVVIGSLLGYGIYRFLRLKVSILTIPLSAMLAVGYSIYKYVSYTRSPSEGYENIENKLRNACEELKNFSVVHKEKVTEDDVLETIEKYGGKPPEMVRMRLFSGDYVEFAGTLFVSKDLDLYEFALLAAYYSVDHVDTRRPHEIIFQVLSELGNKDSNFERKLLEYKIICCLACLLSKYRSQPEKVGEKIYEILNEVGIEESDIRGIEDFMVEGKAIKGFLDKFRKVVEIFPKLEKMYLPGYNMLFETPKDIYSSS